MDKFENILRNKLQNHEVPMPHGEWEKFSQRIQGASPKPSGFKNYLIGGIAAATIGVGVYYFTQDNNATDSNNITVTEQPAGNNTLVTSEAKGSQQAQASQPGTENKGIYYVKTTEPVAHNHSQKHDALVVQDSKKDTELKKQKDNARETNIDNATKKDNVADITNSKKQADTEPAATLLVPEIGGSIAEACQNTEHTFKAANYKAGYIVSWLLNGEEISTEPTVKINFVKQGAQYLQLVYNNTTNGKRNTAESEKRIINVLAAPSGEIAITKMNEEAIPEFKYEATTDAEKLLWSSGDGKLYDGKDVTHVYRKKGEYSVTLLMTGANGCKTKKSEALEVDKDYNLLAPNTFTPNSDGRNDVFIPEALKVMSDVHFRMTIFDKSGKKIFETQRVDNAWDGRNSTTGTMCTRDAYVWRVELTLPNGAKEEYMGSVTLLD